MADPFKQLFGPSPNTLISAQLVALVGCARKSVKFLRESGANDFAGITEIEHEGDRIVREIHRLMDDAFILRFDKNDIASLTSHLDDIIDATRKVAAHKHIYAIHMKELRPEAIALIVVLEKMTEELEPVIARLNHHPIGVDETRAHIEVLKSLEREADDILMAAQKTLVEEFSTGGSPIEYIGWGNLYRIVERASDCANHSGIAVNSMARKEA